MLLAKENIAQAIAPNITVQPGYCRTNSTQFFNAIVAVSPTGGEGSEYTIVFYNELNDTVSTFPVAVFSAPGIYSVKITDSIGQYLTTYFLVDSINPVADFEILSNQFAVNSPAIGDSPLSISLKNKSTGIIEGVFFETTSVLWNIKNIFEPENDEWKLGHNYFQQIDSTLNKPGTYQITLAIENQNGCVDTTTKTLVVNNSEANQYFLIYPNPAAGKIYIVNPNAIENVQVEIFDLKGALLLLKENVGMGEPLNFPFKTGVYVYRFKNQKNREVLGTGKFVFE